MTQVSMFPLGSVLFPHMPLLLRVFEERYLVMLARMLEEESTQFGVVLIERGQEVGGGEQRFAFGTLARIAQLGEQEGVVALVAQGERRFEVVEWLDEAPYPTAVIRDLPDLTWDESLRPLRAQAESAVRRTLALASEFSDMPWASDVELAEEPVAAAWQLAAISPIGPLDQVRLLRAASMKELLGDLLELTTAAAEAYSAPWPDA
ncbi:LON peptidase substrate-binding domain-containing protein [Marisediminicola antarctica]|uniref:Peptidase S16 n=1 Tax=Marisediminicola antarctica TaxID=674079 RepID=A0A7L5ANU8_9MICO|nr:LON peptidase substrate-binding domain-containing protein [Marisediminicola antarctica]QHO70791.1 peptidase S16 [Marisediminicola antarctica]